MVPCAKSHFRIYNDLILYIWPCLMKSGPYKDLVADNNRLKITFPYFVPVFLLNKIAFMAKRELFKKRIECCGKRFLAKIVNRYISIKAAFGFLKSIKAHLAQRVNQ